MSRKKISEPKTIAPSISDVKASLFSEYQWIGLLSGKGKPYDHIIDGLLKIGEYWNSDNRHHEDGTFTMKWFAERLNETPTHVNKWLRAIYDDLFDLNIDAPELFAAEGEILCEFWFSDCRYNSFCSISLGIPVLPHVGDRLNIIFLRAKLGYDYFYIEEIRYERYLGKTKIIIDCKPGIRYNKYRELLLDKARFMGEINFRTEYEERSFILDEMLRVYEIKGHVPSIETLKKGWADRYKH